MFQDSVIEMEDDDIKRDTQSLREWLASWGDGPSWADATGATVPIAKTTLGGLLDALDRMRIERDEYKRRLHNRPPLATRPR